MHHNKQEQYTHLISRTHEQCKQMATQQSQQ